MHSPDFKKIKNYYRFHFWTKEQVRKAVGKQITEEEYKEITGEDY